MTGTVVVLVAIPLLLLGTATVSLTTRGTAEGPLYTPMQFAAVDLRAHLRIGQTLRITGTLRPLWWPHSGAIFQEQGGRQIGVVVIYGPKNPVVSWLRRWPLFGGVIPPTADQPLLNQQATFRVRVVRCRSDIPTCPWRSPALQLQDGGTL